MNFLVHGFNVKDPSNTIGKLKEHLSQSTSFNYGWRLLSVLWHNKKDAKRLKGFIHLNSAMAETDDAVVYAHSNGAAIAVEAARQGARITTLVAINPALKVKTRFPPSIDRVLVIHTKHDRATKAARFFDKIPFIQLLIPNAWGAMGAVGYNGDDNRVININLSKYLHSHVDFFSDRNLNRFMPLIKQSA